MQRLWRPCGQCSGPSKLRAQCASAETPLGISALRRSAQMRQWRGCENGPDTGAKGGGGSSTDSALRGRALLQRHLVAAEKHVRSASTSLHLDP